MINTMRQLLLAVILALVARSIVGHELLIDFLKFPSNHPDVKLSEKCVESLNLINLGIRNEEEWAVKVRDASGKSSSGFIWGNNFWLGHHHYCNLMNNPPKIPLEPTGTRRMYENSTSIASKVPVDYRMFYASHMSPVQFDTELFEFVGLHVGLCFPRDCQESEINKMAERVFQSEVFQKVKFYGNVAFIKTKKLELRENFYDDPFTRILMQV